MVSSHIRHSNDAKCYFSQTFNWLKIKFCFRQMLTVSSDVQFYGTKKRRRKHDAWLYFIFIALCWMNSKRLNKTRRFINSSVASRKSEMKNIWRERNFLWVASTSNLLNYGKFMCLWMEVAFWWTVMGVIIFFFCINKKWA